MTFGEMQNRVRTRMNEGTTTFFSDADIQAALNESYFEYADATEFYEREFMVPLLKWRTYYDLSLILPDTFLSPRRIYNPHTNRWLTPTDPRELDDGMGYGMRQWELNIAEPYSYWLRGNWWLGVWPRPTQDSVGLRFYYTAIPHMMCEDTDEPADLPREFHEGIVSGAISNLMSQQRETKKALLYWQDYKTYEARLQAYVDGRIALAGRPALV